MLVLQNFFLIKKIIFILYKFEQYNVRIFLILFILGILSFKIHLLQGQTILLKEIFLIII